MRRAFFVIAAVNLAIVGWALYDELSTRRPWKKTQAEFNRTLAARKLPEEPIAIREITLPALDLHDRCPTCHLGITRDGFGEDLPRELRTHPRRAELLGPHPPERFGCTPCHQGQGAQTKGVSRARFDHGRDDPYWERPLYTGVFVESTCLDCHEAPPKGAPTLARGARLFEEQRCHGCHATPRLDPPRGLPATSLALLRQKTSRRFVEAWLRDSQAIRPGNEMPDFRLGGEEPAEIAAYLASDAARPEKQLPEGPTLPEDLDDPPLIAEGRALFDKVGCRGCHLLPGDEAAPSPLPPEARFGPRLDAIGEKASAPWLAAWLGRPSAVWADTNMPDPRLSDGEIGKLTAFLRSLRRPGEPAATTDWPAPDPARAAAGKQVILKVGCAGCHEIPGIAREGRPGPDLDGFGDRPPDELYFGDGDPNCGALSPIVCFTLGKLREPRRFVGRAAPELVMPDHRLSEEDARALAVFVLAARSRPIAERYRRPLDPKQRAVEESERILTRRNCRGCHEIGHGGYITRHYAEPGLAPPPLTDAGRKFQYPWLWDFLRAPRTIRPFLAPRMPDFHLGDDEIQALAAGFAARAGEPYPVQNIVLPRVADTELAEARALWAKLKCRQCHPASAGEKLDVQSQAELAPDLALTPMRLKPAWVRAWLVEPQDLQRNTRMPTFFAPLDEDKPDVRAAVPGFLGNSTDRQIDALVGLTMSGQAR